MGAAPAAFAGRPRRFGAAFGAAIPVAFAGLPRRLGADEAAVPAALAGRPRRLGADDAIPAALAGLPRRLGAAFGAAIPAAFAGLPRRLGADEAEAVPAAFAGRPLRLGADVFEEAALAGLPRRFGAVKEVIDFAGRPRRLGAAEAVEADLAGRPRRFGAVAPSVAFAARPRRFGAAAPIEEAALRPLLAGAAFLAAPGLRPRRAGALAAVPSGTSSTNAILAALMYWEPSLPLTSMRVAPESIFLRMPVTINLAPRSLSALITVSAPSSNTNLTLAICLFGPPSLVGSSEPSRNVVRRNRPSLQDACLRRMSVHPYLSS